MLTVDFDRLGVKPGDRVLDLGCGAGRHAFELYRRGTHVVALDQNELELHAVSSMFEAMREAGESGAGPNLEAVGPLVGIGAHCAQNVQNARPRWVEADIEYSNFKVWVQSARDEEKRRR